MSDKQLKYTIFLTIAGTGVLTLLSLVSEISAKIAALLLLCLPNAQSGAMQILSNLLNLLFVLTFVLVFIFLSWKYLEKQIKKDRLSDLKKCRDYGERFNDQSQKAAWINSAIQLLDFSPYHHALAIEYAKNETNYAINAIIGIINSAIESLDSKTGGKL